MSWQCPECKLWSDLDYYCYECKKSFYVKPGHTDQALKLVGSLRAVASFFENESKICNHAANVYFEAYAKGIEGARAEDTEKMAAVLRERIETAKKTIDQWREQMKDAKKKKT